jgi:hypothetical protein
VVVADSHLKAETLVGYVDSATIDQAVVDAIRASGGSTLKNPYLRRVDALCVASANQVKALQQPASASAVPTYLAAVHAISVDGDNKLRAIKPPKKYAGYHKAFYREGAENTAIVATAMNKAKANPAQSVRILRSTSRKLDRREKQFVAEHGAKGLSCF